MIQTDIIVIGAGIAGASVAAHLAETHRVILLEQEDRAGYHSTGRSAALFTEIYGNPVIRALTRASRKFLFAPPPDFTEGPLTHPRGCLFIATAAQVETLRQFAALPDIAPATRPVSVAEARLMCPFCAKITSRLVYSNPNPAISKSTPCTRDTSVCSGDETAGS